MPRPRRSPTISQNGVPPLIRGLADLPGRSGTHNMEKPPMATIDTIDAISSKWARVTPGRQQDYVEGVQSPRTDWQRATTEAANAWKEGVTKAVAQNSFANAVKRTPTDKWQRAAVDKGSQRWGPGVQLGQSAYSEGFAPFRDVIQSIQLPPRFARRDPRNFQRVQAIAEALAKKKQQLLGQ